jgi:hypothetical protein
MDYISQHGMDSCYRQTPVIVSNASMKLQNNMHNTNINTCQQHDDDDEHHMSTGDHQDARTLYTVYMQRKQRKSVDPTFDYAIQFESPILLFDYLHIPILFAAFFKNFA